MTSIELGQLGLLFAMAMSLNIAYMIWRTVIFGSASGLVWFLFGAFMYSLGAAGDLWRLTGTFVIFLGAFVWFDVYTCVRTERKEEQEEALAEDLESLKEDYYDAIDNCDYKLAKKIHKQIADTKLFRETIDAETKYDPQSHSVRTRVRRSQQRNYMRKFEDQGEI